MKNFGTIKDSTMRLLKLTQYAIQNVKPSIYKSASNKLYYNIILGSKPPHGRTTTIKLDSLLFDPVKQEDLILENDNYILKPYIRNNKVDKDSHGNTNFVLTQDNNGVHKRDILVLWEIPNNRYTNVRYHIEGEVNILSRAISGKTSNDQKFTSPYLLLEVYGSCNLEWTGLDKDNRLVKQTVDYNEYPETWDIGIAQAEI